MWRVAQYPHDTFPKLTGKKRSNRLDVFSIALTAINNPVAPWMVSIHPCSKEKQVD